MKKKFLIICCVAVIGFYACEPNSSEVGEPDSSELGKDGLLDSQLANLEKKTVLFDGQEIFVYEDKESKQKFLIQEGGLISFEELIDKGNIGFYLSADFEGYALFSSKERLNDILQSSDKLNTFNQKMNVINPVKKVSQETDKGASTLSSNPKVTIATAHSLGGDQFTDYLLPWWGGDPLVAAYSNPHLRCNQYETDCIDFNDKISSIHIVDVVAEFYSGSFQNFGSWLYLNALGGETYISNLAHIGWNDKITAFWADINFRVSTDISGLLTDLGSCSHNYNDPQCP